MRVIYLIAGCVVATFVLFNVPRTPWINAHDGVSFILFRGFNHGMIGFSYLMTWTLILGGIYQLILGVVYWDMDTTEGQRWEYLLQSGSTARLLWITGFVTLALGIWYAVFVYGHDRFLWPAGIISTLFAIITCWLFWLAFPLYEQVGMDRDELHS